jgi:cytochrome c
MKILYVAMAAAACLLGSQMASAAVDMAAGEALAKKSNCLACHTVDKKIVGPAYKDVAKKYKGVKDAEEKLIKKVKAGGAGVYGPIPMPPNSPKVSDADIKTLVEWVLAQKTE